MRGTEPASHRNGIAPLFSRDDRSLPRLDHRQHGGHQDPGEAPGHKKVVARLENDPGGGFGDQHCCKKKDSRDGSWAVSE